MPEAKKKPPTYKGEEPIKIKQNKLLSNKIRGLY